MTQALGFALSADTSRLLAKMVEAGQITEREGKKMARSLQYVTDELKRVNASQKAANEAVADVEKGSKAMEHFGFQTSAAKRELLVLAHELSQGNYSRFGGSLLVLGERTNAMELAFSAAGAAAGATAIVVGSFAAAAIMGAHQTEELRKSLILTGNAAGITSSSFVRIAEDSAKAAEASVGMGREALQALVSTGRLGQEAIQGATQATLLMEKLTGQSAEEIAKDFARMGDGVAKWAEEHNRQYHYLTASQFAYIKQLEDQGKVEQAEAENFRLLNERMGQVNTNLGTLERAWADVTGAAKGAWQAMLNIGRPDTEQQKLDKIAKDLQREQDTLTGYLQNSSSAKDIHAVELKIMALKQEQAQVQENMRLQQRAADLDAANAAKAEAAIKKMMTKPAAEANAKSPREQFMGPPTFDTMFPASNTAALLKYQKDNLDARREFFLQEKKDGEELAKRFEVPKPAVKSALESYYETAQNQTAKSMQMIVGGLHTAEDAFIDFARTGKLNISSLFAYLAEQTLRAKFETMAADLITAGGGPKNFSLSTLFSAATTWFAGFGHANGLSYVPYDGYPAILHEGERVQTALEARGGSASNNARFDFSGATYNIGQGVGRAEVMAAITQANAQTQLQIRRQMRQGVLS